MLRACRSLLRDGGRLAYLTIVTAPNLEPARYKHALRAGPSAVAARAPDDLLMQKANFADIAVDDVTAEFLVTARRWHNEFSRHEADVKATIGEAAWEERQSSRAQTVRAIEDGLLKRVLVSGRAA